jgi:SAM-dependent methyltransferase
MKLSQIIAFRESLEDLPYQDSMMALQHDLQICSDTLDQSPVDLDVHRGTIQDVVHSVERDLENFRGGIDIIKKHIDREIVRLGKQYFIDSYTHYESIQDEPLDNLLNRELRCSEEGDRLLRHYIKTNSNWQFPGVLIRPQRESYYTDMVDSDPLYLLDTDYDLLEPCLSSVTENYRTRLRRGMIDENSELLLPGIPRSQIGFVFAWNFFNYRPVEVLKRYFNEIYDVLRPGGTFLFTYNNCSRSMPVILCEHAFASFTPDWAVESLLKSLGFEITDRHDGDYHLNFLEARKPGDLTTLRGGQTLAVINAKPWTRARMQELRTLANELGVAVDPSTVDYDQLEQELESILEQKREDERRAEELRHMAEDQRLEVEIQTLEQQIQEARERKRLGLETQAQEQLRLEKEQRLSEIDQRRAWRKSIKERAEGLNIPDRDTLEFDELARKVEHIEHMKELNDLRKEAVRLKLDRTDLIMRQYTLKELKRAIKKWRAENERPST